VIVRVSLGCILGCICHAGADLFLVGSELNVKDYDTVDPGFYIFNSIKFFLCSTISKAECRVEVGNVRATLQSSTTPQILARGIQSNIKISTTQLRMHTLQGGSKEKL